MFPFCCNMIFGSIISHMGCKTRRLSLIKKTNKYVTKCAFMLVLHFATTTFIIWHNSTNRVIGLMIFCNKLGTNSIHAVSLSSNVKIISDNVCNSRVTIICLTFCGFMHSIPEHEILIYFGTNYINKFYQTFSLNKVIKIIF